MDDEKDDKQYNKSKIMKKSPVCNEGVKHQEEAQGSISTS